VNPLAVLPADREFIAGRRGTLPHGGRGVALLLLVAPLLAGCAFLSSPAREFASNHDVLEAVARELGFRVDSRQFRLERAEVCEDSVTLHYVGVDYPGDRAWVVRFSEKSTELAPESLASVAPAIAVIRDERLLPEFAPSPPRRVAIGGEVLEVSEYTFRSTLAPPGRTGQGIVAAIERTERGHPVVYQIKLDNFGDRKELSVEALAPFVDALPGTRPEHTSSHSHSDR